MNSIQVSNTENGCLKETVKFPKFHQGFQLTPCRIDLDLPLACEVGAQNIIQLPNDTQSMHLKIFDSKKVESTIHNSWFPSVFDCISHLRFLQTIIALRSNTERWAISWGISFHTAWGIFINLASVRFILWVEGSKYKTKCTDIPVDILLVWHAFMLNPENYDRYTSFQKFHNCDEGINWSELASSYWVYQIIS